MEASLIGGFQLACAWHFAGDKRMACGERNAVTAPVAKLEETEKNRHQVCADGGEQRSTRKLNLREREQ